MGVCFFFFKQKTAYEMRISDWSSYVCSSDLATVDQAKIDDINGDFRVVASGQQAPGRVLDRLRGYRAVVHVHGRFSGLETQGVAIAPFDTVQVARSEERRVGQACVSTCRSRWSPYH